MQAVKIPERRRDGHHDDCASVGWPKLPAMQCTCGSRLMHQLRGRSFEVWKLKGGGA